MEHLVILSAVKAMEMRSQEVPSCISLAQGTPAGDTPEIIKTAAIEAIRSGQAAPYSPPNGLRDLRMAVAARLSSLEMNYRWQDEILITAGASQAIVAVLTHFLRGPKNEAIITSPSYAGYPAMIAAAGGKPRYVNLIYPGWHLTEGSLQAALTPSSRVILLAHPNNPTGHIFTRSELEIVLNFARENDLYVISDEVYADLVYDDRPFVSPAMLDKDRVIRIHSLSKSFSMTGWRVAYVHGPAEIIERILPFHDAIITCAPTVAQYAALAAFEDYDRLVAARQEVFSHHRRLVTEILGINPESSIYPAAAYFIFLPVASEFAAEELLDNFGVATVPGVAFGPNCQNFIRVCFGRETEKIIRGCGIIRGYLDKEQSI